MRKLLVFGIMTVFILSLACHPEKATTQRRGLMMPKKSELPRNKKKYVERERNYSR